MPAPSRSRSFGPWLGLAGAVHLLIWAMWRERSSAERVATANSKVDALEVEILPPDEQPAQVNVEADSPARALEAPLPLPRESASATQASEPTPAAPTPIEAALGPATAAPETTPPTALGDQVASESAPSANTETSSPGVGAPTGVSEGASPASSASPADRLAALGYGAPNAAALRPLLDVSPTAIAEDRLNLHLAQAIVDDDRDHSLGIEGPVTNALHTGAMGVVWPKSLSKVAITIGRDGKLADFRIIETNRDARALKALGERVKKLLANQTVRVPPGRAMEFVYEVKSEVLLPSGRAPGLAVEAFGIPLKEGRDEKSSKISILTPHLEFKSHSLPDPEHNGKITQTPPQLVYGIDVLGIDADVVDIGANERQVVRTRLIQQRVL